MVPYVPQLVERFGASRLEAQTQKVFAPDLDRAKVFLFVGITLGLFNLIMAIFIDNVASQTLLLLT